MVRDIAVFAVASAFWVGFAYKARHLRQRASGPGGPALRALVVLLGTMAASVTLGAPVISAVVDPAVGMPGVTRLVANLLSLGTCLALREWLLHLSRPDDAVRQIAFHRRFFVPIVALILGLYAFDHPPVTAEQEFAGAYTYVYLLYVLATAPVAAMYWDYARKVDLPMMRLGLRLAGTGTGIGLSGIGLVLLYMLEADLGLSLPGTPTTAKIMYSTGSAVFVLGIILPAVGPRLGLDVVWFRAYRRRAARQLRFLWSAVTTACPGVVLDRGLLAVSPYRDRLLVERLPVEIYDGWLELRHYLRTSDVDLVNRLSTHGRGRDRDRSARVAAAYVAIAIERKSKGESPTPAGPVVEHFGQSRSSSLHADVRFLCDVSAQLGSTAVRRICLATCGASGAYGVRAT